MAYLVKLHIFSGRPDPVWAISDKEAAALAEVQRATPEELFDAHSKAAPAQPAHLGLGYRGFSLIASEAEHPHGALLTEALPDAHQRREAFISQSPEAERMLLETASRTLNPDILQAVREAIVARPKAGGVSHACPACHGATAPAYDPAFWNNNPARLANNNCYNYANNNPTNTFAQPGRASGHMYTALQCPNVRAAAVSDGLQVTGNFSAAIPGWYVALVIWPGQDYHWYRQDKNGCWSHKPGSTPARNVDNAGHTISDPKTCDRGPYTVFCTYMRTHKGIKIQ
ncbi:MAG TPA: hypothetical protein VGD66_00900 [Allosphingosinicella sp.]|jgi:hypothetical protein